MKSSMTESKKNIGFSRILDKLLHTIAKSSLLGSKARVFIHHLRGVKFKNRSTVFIGEEHIISIQKIDRKILNIISDFIMEK